MDTISRKRQSTFGLFVKLVTVGLSGLVAAAIPFTGFYFLWSWCMVQIPLAAEWAGLAKIALTLGMIIVGGGITVFAAFLAGVLALSLTASILLE